MEANKKVWNIMTADLKTVNAHTSFAEIKDLFEKNNFHHLPVEDKFGEILGIISSADLIRADRFPIEKSKIEARHIMTISLDTVNMDTTVPEVLNIFLEKNFRALPVMDQSNVFVGLVTTHDLLRSYQEQLIQLTTNPKEI